MEDGWALRGSQHDSELRALLCSVLLVAGFLGVERLCMCAAVPIGQWATLHRAEPQAGWGDDVQADVGQ